MTDPAGRRSPTGPWRRPRTAIGEADGAHAGLAALAAVDPGLPRHTAASAYLHESAGGAQTASRWYAEAARSANNLAERDHLTPQAARINKAPQG